MRPLAPERGTPVAVGLEEKLLGRSASVTAIPGRLPPTDVGLEEGLSPEQAQQEIMRLHADGKADNLEFHLPKRGLSSVQVERLQPEEMERRLAQVAAGSPLFAVTLNLMESQKIIDVRPRQAVFHRIQEFLANKPPRAQRTSVVLYAQTPEELKQLEGSPIQKGVHYDLVVPVPVPTQQMAVDLVTSEFRKGSVTLFGIAVEDRIIPVEGPGQPPFPSWSDRNAKLVVTGEIQVPAGQLSPADYRNQPDVRRETGGPSLSAARVLAQISRPVIDPSHVMALKVSHVARIGDDDAGRQLVESLSRQGVDVSGMQVVPGVPTATTLALVLPDARSVYNHVRGASDRLTGDDLRPADYQAKVLGIHGAELAAQFMPGVLPVLRKAKAAKQIVTWDTVVDLLHHWASFSPSDFREILSLIDVFIPSVGEALAIIQQREKLSDDAAAAMTPEQIADYFMEGNGQRGTRAVFLKLGDKGSFIRTLKTSVFGRETALRLPVLQGLKIVDETGMGDAYAGAVMKGILMDWPVEKIALVATATGGLVGENFGGTLGDRGLVDVLLAAERLKSQADVQTALSAAGLEETLAAYRETLEEMDVFKLAAQAEAAIGDPKNELILKQILPDPAAVERLKGHIRSARAFSLNPKILAHPALVGFLAAVWSAKHPQSESASSTPGVAPAAGLEDVKESIKVEKPPVEPVCLAAADTEDLLTRLQREGRTGSIPFNYYYSDGSSVVPMRRLVPLYEALSLSGKTTGLFSRVESSGEIGLFSKDSPQRYRELWQGFRWGTAAEFFLPAGLEEMGSTGLSLQFDEVAERVATRALSEVLSSHQNVVDLSLSGPTGALALTLRTSDGAREWGRQISQKLSSIGVVRSLRDYRVTYLGEFLGLLRFSIESGLEEQVRWFLSGLEEAAPHGMAAIVFEKGLLDKHPGIRQVFAGLEEKKVFLMGKNQKPEEMMVLLIGEGISNVVVAGLEEEKIEFLRQAKLAHIDARAAGLEDVRQLLLTTIAQATGLEEAVVQTWQNFERILAGIEEADSQA